MQIPWTRKNNTVKIQLCRNFSQIKLQAPKIVPSALHPSRAVSDFIKARERRCSCTWVCLINSAMISDLISQKNKFSEQEAFYQPDSLTCTSSCLLASSKLGNRRLSKMNNWTTFTRWRLGWYTKYIYIFLYLLFDLLLELNSSRSHVVD